MMATQRKKSNQRTYGKDAGKPEKEQGKRTYGTKPKPKKKGGSGY